LLQGVGGGAFIPTAAGIVGRDVSGEEAAIYRAVYQHFPDWTNNRSNVEPGWSAPLAGRIFWFNAPLIVIAIIAVACSD